MMIPFNPKVINGLPLKVFMVAIIVLTMYNNLEHSATVYLGIAANTLHSDGYNKFQSYMVVVVFDLAVIAFIIKAKNTESVVFAVLLFVINCLFFNVTQSVYNIIFKACSIPAELLRQNQAAVKSLIGEINAVVAKVVFAALFSYCIHRFSHLWYEQKKEESLLQVVAGKEKVIAELHGELEQVRKLLEQLREDNNGLKSSLERKVKELEQARDELNDAELEKSGMQAKLSRKKINGLAVS